MAKTLYDVVYEEKIKTKHRFGSDYYVRQASSPAGMRLKSPEGQENYGFPAYDEDILFPEPSITQNRRSPEQFQRADEVDADLHRAVPVIVHQEAELIKPEIKPRLNRPPDLPETGSIASEMTSDSDMSYVNFYDVQNSQVYKTAKQGAPDENANTTAVLDRNPSERPKYLKLKSTAPHQPRLPQKVEPQSLRRHKSETDLANGPFDRPLTVVSRKKDNTLISKIYLDPQVRSFAMSSRSGMPIGAQPASAFRSQSSLSETVTMSGSRDDLLSSLDSSQANNYEIKSARMSLSSEDDLLSDRSGSLNVNKNFARLSTYSSSDDLLSLSIEDSDKPRKKRDNTLISKIYQQANVRNYALSNRDYTVKKSTSSDEEVFSEEAKPKSSFTTKQFLENLKSVETVTPDVRKEDQDGMTSPDPDIGEIAKRKIVHNFLTKFSKSQSDSVPGKKTRSGEDNQLENGDEEEISVSVRDLKKKFENNQS